MNEINTYKKNGFIVQKIFETKEIEEYESTFADLCKMQLKKLNLDIKTNDIQDNIILLNKKNPEAIDETAVMARHSSIGHKLASNKKLYEISSKLLKNKNSTNIISGPTLLVNIPNNKERKYSWHSEQNFYVKRRNFLGVWSPVFEDRTNNNSMGLKQGSHKKDWIYYSEYRGYDTAGKNDGNQIIQHEIPEKFLKDYKTLIPKVKRTEAIVWNGKTVHRSLDIKISKILFTIVFMIYDYSNDLTLAANWADRPNNGKVFGVPNINVD